MDSDPSLACMRQLYRLYNCSGSAIRDITVVPKHKSTVFKLVLQCSDCRKTYAKKFLRPYFLCTGPNFLSYCKILPTAHIYPQKFFWPFGPQNYLQILHFFLKNLPNPTYFPKNSGKSYIFFLKNRQNPSYSINLPPKNFFGPSGHKITYKSYISS